MAYQPKDVKERILHRLKIAQGHLKKVMDMVESDTYCIDVINQSRAVQSALAQADAVLLENHLKCCVKDALQAGASEKAISEVVEVFKKRS